MEDPPLPTDTIQRLRALDPDAIGRARRLVAARRLSGHALVAEALRRCGIRRVFGIPGTPVDPLFAECAGRGMRLIGARHQQAAGLMAAAANYVAGRAESAVIISAGPAVTNVATALLVARENGWPLIALGGRRALAPTGVGHFQDLDAIPLLSTITKEARVARSTADLTPMIFHAFATASKGRPGPVYLDLPEDVLIGSASADSAPAPQAPPRDEPNPATIGRAAALLASSDRPLLILGEELRWFPADTALERLVGRCGIPFITSPMGRGLLPDDHPLCANDIRHEIQARADTVIMAGAWFDWRFRFGCELAPGARVIHAHSEPSTIGKNIHLAAGCACDPGAFLSRLADAFDGADACHRRCSPWREAIAQGLASSRRRREAWLHHESSPMSPQCLFREIRDSLPADAIVTVEGNVSLACAQRILIARRPASCLDPGQHGCMGTALPFAMGAKLALPERPVIALCSDMGFALNAVEFETAVRHRIPVVAVIANNDGNTGALRQQRHLPGHPEKFSQYLPGLRYDRFVETLGAHAAWITRATDVRPALLAALDSGLPACINVAVDPCADGPGPW
ncbi:MAG: thiamine pyrophosphate-binding protein [Verrucomicrobiae bacterium]|nr:thiamine pyrophosphate-binding protein [Verrucomicrobiae bacterium]